MNLKLLRTVSFFLAISGLFLIYLFSPNQEQNRSSLTGGCSGQMAIEANVSKVSATSDGLIVTIYQNKSRILVFLKDAFAQEGDRIFVTGKASRFSNQCWIFPERVEVR
jgi:hypothetical protein